MKQARRHDGQGQPPQPGRRRFLATTAAMGGALAAGRTLYAQGAGTGARTLGKGVSKFGTRSPFETVERLPIPGRNPETAISFAPIASTYGRLTPASLHFERHHAGVPTIDPAEHRLLIHGMVDRPLSLTYDDILRLPAISRVHFLECAGNSFTEWSDKTAPTAQQSHGLLSGSEWTGVPLRLLLQEVGVQPGAAWMVAEGADACRLARSVPLAKALDDALVVYGQNGEALRPEQGYPLRLILPGFEGITNVKWLHRLEISASPSYARDETSHYTELRPDGKAWIYAFTMDVKSVVTQPSGGQHLTARGFHEIRGLAWSGRGVVRRVEVSLDGGSTWADAALDEPVLPRALSPFRLPWRWDGRPVQLVSRATDEAGYVQPTRRALVAARGPNFGYHNNGQKLWLVGADGAVKAEGQA
jgi:sulfane dehydrogenase subunit SoxC